MYNASRKVIICNNIYFTAFTIVLSFIISFCQLLKCQDKCVCRSLCIFVYFLLNSIASQNFCIGQEWEGIYLLFPLKEDFSSLFLLGRFPVPVTRCTRTRTDVICLYWGQRQRKKKSLFVKGRRVRDRFYCSFLVTMAHLISCIGTTGTSKGKPINKNREASKIKNIQKCHIFPIL